MTRTTYPKAFRHTAAGSVRVAVALLAFTLATLGVIGPAQGAETPTGLSAEVGVEVVHLQWEYSSLIAPDSFRVHRATDGEPEVVAELPGTARSFTDENVIGGVTYRYSVSATDLLGEGPRSAEVSATPLAAPDPVAADAPRDLTATADFTATNETWPTREWTDVALQWSPPAAGAPDHYVVYRLSCPYRWTLSLCQDVYETETIGRVPNVRTSLKDFVPDGHDGMAHHYWVAGVVDGTAGSLSNRATVTEPCTWC